MCEKISRVIIVKSYLVFKDLAIIIVVAKLFGIGAKKCKAPEVVGSIIAGIVIGPTMLGLVKQTDFLSQMAEIGVLLLMFSAGLETNLKDLMKTGVMAFLIACAGVAIPLIGGTLLYMGFYGYVPTGDPEFIKAVYIGTIMTATSVSITVQVLKEMGHLSEKVGTTILSAAIIDDVIGVIVLTIVIGMKDPNSKPMTVVSNTVLFFALSIIVGIIIYKIFKIIDKRHPHTRRVPILGLALCFTFGYVAEAMFGIADITGAFVAGIILCNINDSDYIARKMDVSSYMLFGPIFFTMIGLKADLSGLNKDMLFFSIAFVAVALITKIIGCGLMGKLCRFNNKDSLKIGVGMMTRGEVALIVSQKGLNAGIIESKYFASVILLIIVSSIVTPILLKILYKEKQEIIAQ